MSLENDLIYVSIGLGVLLLCWYGGTLIYGLINKKRTVFLRSLRLLINFSVVLYLCYATLIFFSLYVRPPFKMADTELSSLKKLSAWIISEEVRVGMWLCLVIIALGGFAYWFQVKFERLRSLRPIVNLTIVNFIIVLVALILIYLNTYQSLATEVGYNFR